MLDILPNRTSGPGFIPFRKAAIFGHRWLGVALSLVFLLWFTSGVVMMYHTFPEVTAADRLNRFPALDASRIHVLPGEAYAKLGASQPPGQVRLNTFDGRPVYRFRTGRREWLVYADSGEEQTAVSPEMLGRIASAWTAQPIGAAQVESIQEADQWTLEGGLRTLRPLWKYSWPNGEQVYISGLSGEVMQYTTRESRQWAWLGAIPHWLYFTPIRKHQREWAQFVIWASGTAAFTAILGITVGLLMYSPRKRYRHAGVPTGIPYRGQKRWHTILGLIFGVAAATWAFSGMLSMDPFPNSAGFSTRGGPDAAGPLRGTFQLTAFEAKSPAEALAQLKGFAVKELELTSFAGEPVYLAAMGRRETRIVPVLGEVRTRFDPARIMAAVRGAGEPAGFAELRVMDEYDAYYVDRRHEKPLPVIFAQLNDAGKTRWYIDLATARIVGSYSSAGWMNRWLYHGLHSLDFPWLYKYRPLWDIVVISFMLGGSALCVTSLILAWRVLLRTAGRWF